MTEAFDLLMDGEYLQALLNPGVRIIGLEWMLFFILGAILIFLYLKTESIALPMMIGLTVLATANISQRLGRLFPSMDTFPLIPHSTMDWLFAMLLIGALGFLLYSVIFKK